MHLRILSLFLEDHLQKASLVLTPFENLAQELMLDSVVAQGMMWIIEPDGSCVSNRTGIPIHSLPGLTLMLQVSYALEESILQAPARNRSDQ